MPDSRTLASSLAISVGVETHAGRSRTENQDRVSRSACPFGDLFVLADGVGGYQGGAEAAQIVVDGYAAYLARPSELPLEEALQQATQFINSELNERLAASNVQQGLGSTVVLCVLHDRQATYAHAGDSRIYLVRGGALTQLSHDHSVMERMISHGILTPEQARHHPDASALTRALGLLPEVSLDVATIELQPRDALLLCSDGLWAYASHAEMEAIAATEGLSAAAVAEALLNVALEGGGGDNVSIQFLQFSAADQPVLVHEPVQEKRRAGTVAKVVMVAACVVAGGAALGLFIWNQQHPLVRQAAAVLPNAVTAIEGAAAAAVPAQTTGRPGSSPSGTAQTGRTVVTIVRRDAKSAAPWADRLGQLDYLQLYDHSGSEACLALGRPDATLFYLHDRRSLAIRVREDLASSHIQIAELTRDAADLCGGGELIAMPSDSGIGQGITGAAKDKVDSMKSRIRDMTN